MIEDLINKIFNVSKQGFDKLALDIFNYQYNNNKIYNDYVNHLKINVKNIGSINKIPFLPIIFFKTHKVITGNKKNEKVFTSSGTTGSIPSYHYVNDISVYIRSFKKSFQLFYGDITDHCILALLPSYLERENSSLVYMINNFINESKHNLSGFYLHNYNDLLDKLRKLEKLKQKTILFGVSYALIDIAKIIDFPLNYTTIIETGGMKGKRKEIPKTELHKLLKKGFGLSEIHSEYGMTELLSQAYSKKNGGFYCPPWMKILIRDAYDPFMFKDSGKSGGINVIDLANIYSCSFIETKDIGKINNNGSFEVLGRLDNSDIRGCNLLFNE